MLKKISELERNNEVQNMLSKYADKLEMFSTFSSDITAIKIGKDNTNSIDEKMAIVKDICLSLSSMGFRWFAEYPGMNHLTIDDHENGHPLDLFNLGNSLEVVWQKSLSSCH